MVCCQIPGFISSSATMLETCGRIITSDYGWYCTKLINFQVLTLRNISNWWFIECLMVLIVQKKKHLAFLVSIVNRISLTHKNKPSSCDCLYWSDLFLPSNNALMVSSTSPHWFEQHARADHDSTIPAVVPVSPQFSINSLNFIFIFAWILFSHTATEQADFFSFLSLSHN